MSVVKPKAAKKAGKAQKTRAGHNLTAEKSPAPENTGAERDKVGPGNPPKEHQFKAGNPGRPKGARNKLGEAFLQDMLADWEVHGVDTIQKVRLEKPDVYLKTVASILPQQLNVKVSEWDDLTDEQLDQRIASLARALELEIGNGQAHGVPAQSPAGKPLN